MKKLIFTLILMLSALSASAEIGVEKIMDSFSLFSFGQGMIVAEDGISDFVRAYYETDYEKKEVSVFIYDENYDIIKKMVFKGYENIPGIDGAGSNVIASFNWIVKNDKWCVILYKDLDETDQWGNPLKKMIVLDEDGILIGELPFGNSFLTMELNCGKPYLACQIGTSSDFALYKFTGSNNVEAVKVADKRAYPNPLRSGQVFTVELPQSADSHTVLVVTDMSGRQVARQRIESGADKIVLSNARFGHGQYIYTIIYGDGTSESGKLLAE